MKQKHRIDHDETYPEPDEDALPDAGAAMDEQHSEPDEDALPDAGLAVDKSHSGLDEDTLPDAGLAVDKPHPISTYLKYDPEISYPGAGEEREHDNPSPKPILDEKFNRKLLTFMAKEAPPEEVAALVEWGRLANPELTELFIETTKPKAPKVVAPLLWADRTTGREVSPAEFIKLHYGETAKDGSWDGKGITRADLKLTDIGLYNAYAQQIRRNPGAAIPELPTEHRNEANPAAELERQRAAKRRYYHRNKSI